MKKYQLFKTTADFIAWVEVQKRFSAKVNLDKMLYWSNLIGNPHEKIQFIHVTGTNGKGSTTSFIATILQTSGYNVGTYTSPYVTYFNERIMYNGTPICDNDLLRCANEIYRLYEQPHEYDLPTFFEFITLLAFLFFAEIKKTDFVVCEVGMGGKLDSTNIITPLVSVITNVSLDHMNILGDTIPAILEQKLGIVKKNIPLVTYIKEPHLRQQILDFAKNTNSPVVFACDEQYKITKMTIDETTFETPTFGENTIHLLGFHQIENAILSLMVIKTLEEVLFRKSKKASFELLYKRGLALTNWPGRLEKLSVDPLIIIDGGHNRDGITRVTELVKHFDYSYKRCVFACSDDKEKAVMIALLEPFFDEVIFTAFSYKRHSNAEELFEVSNHPSKHLMINLDSIVDHVFKNTVPFTLFIGSLYFVSEMRPKILNYHKK